MCDNNNKIINILRNSKEKYQLYEISKFFYSNSYISEDILLDIYNKIKKKTNYVLNILYHLYTTCNINEDIYIYLNVNNKEILGLNNLIPLHNF